MFVIIKNWNNIPNNIPMHLSSDSGYITKYMVFFPTFLSLLSFFLLYLYRKKNRFKSPTDLFLQYAISVYFLYIGSFYTSIILDKTNLFFNKLVLLSLPIIIVASLIIIEVCTKLRKEY